MPSGTPVCRISKNSASGSELMSDRACHKFRRKGWPSSISRNLDHMAGSDTCSHVRRSEKNGRSSSSVSAAEIWSPSSDDTGQNR